MGRLNGRSTVRSMSIVWVAILLMASSCIEAPSPDAGPSAADIEGEAGGTVARLYGPASRHARDRLAAALADPDVVRAVACYTADGYEAVPEGGLVLAGSSSGAHIEVTLICLRNAFQPQRDLIYLAAIDAGGTCGIAPARFWFEQPLDGAAYRAAGEGVWLEMLPQDPSSAETAGRPETQAERWVWEEFWSCYNSLVLASAAGCSISCLPAIPEGYLVCYFTCVGGAAIAAVIRCTIEQLFE